MVTLNLQLGSSQGGADNDTAICSVQCAELSQRQMGFYVSLRMACDYMSGVLKTRVSQDPMERKQVQRIIAVNLNRIVATAHTCSGVISESDL